MKKTLISSVVAASVVMSCSVMAAPQYVMKIGGEVTVSENVTPWEIIPGRVISGLNVDIKKGQSEVSFIINETIPILGIRTQATQKIFQGQSGYAPQIDYGGAVDVDKFVASVAPLTLEVKSIKDNKKIGSLKTRVWAQGRTSMKGGSWEGKFWNYAWKAGNGFWGGVPKSKEAVSTVDRVDELMPDAGIHYDNQGMLEKGVEFTGFGSSATSYSAYYYSVLEKGKLIQITLDNPVSGDELIQWKASLPIIISYY